MNVLSTDRLERGTSLSPWAVWLRVVLSLGGRWLPNQALQATAAALGSFTFSFSHNAVVADASALPAAVPELGRWAKDMSSWIKCTCGTLLHKNLFCGASVSVVVEDTVLDGISEDAPARVALDKIVLEGDTLVRCRKCGCIAIEDKKSGAIRIYAAVTSQ